MFHMYKISKLKIENSALLLFFDDFYRGLNHFINFLEKKL